MHLRDLWAKRPAIAARNVHHVHAVSSRVTPVSPVSLPGRAEGCFCYTFYYAPRYAKGPLPARKGP
jgi:hypothetical protein